MGKQATGGTGMDDDAFAAREAARWGEPSPKDYPPPKRNDPPVAKPSLPPEAPPLYLSPDGNWRWDGQQWVPFAPRTTPAPPVQKDNSRLVFGIVIGAVVTVLGLAWLGSGLGTSSGSGSGSAGVAALRTVVYQLDGNGTADITFSTPTGTSQTAGVTVPMKSKTGTNGLTLKFPEGGFVYFSAQQMQAVGPQLELTCRIVVDGTVISENTSYGFAAIASCDGSVP